LAKYVSPDARAKRRKQQQARRMAMYATIAVFILTVSFGIVKVIEAFSTDDGELPLLDNSTTQQEQNIQQEVRDYTMGPVLTDMDRGIVAPDIATLQVTPNGRVDVSYFDDVLFLGDSLADGFKVYAGWMSLKNTGAGYLTQRGTTPRTFLQPKAMVDAGQGPVDVWATIEQKQPGKMYITLGTNALMGMDPVDMMDGYRQLIEKIQSASPDTVIYVTTITPTTAKTARAKPQLSHDRITQTNRLIADMCNQMGVHLINLDEILKASDGYLRSEIAAGDGYHLTPTGYKQWLEYLITHTVYDPDSPYIPGSPYYMA